MPQLVRAIKAMKLKPGWLDGEIVVLNESGSTDFQALQNAFDKEKTSNIVYFLFDLPYYDGFDLTGVPPNGPALLAGAPTAARLPFGGCTVLVTPGVATILTMASASGFATVPLPLPNNPALVGQLFFFQAVTLAPATPLGLAFSDGLRIALGQ